MGCYANHPDDYEVFKPFFRKALEAYHKVDLNKVSHTNSWDLSTISGLPSSGKLDLT